MMTSAEEPETIGGGVSKAVDTPTFIALCIDADKRKYNRCIAIEKIEDKLDPEGLHILAPIMFHNDTEWRCLCLVKVKNRQDPETLFLDIHPTLFDQLNTCKEYLPLSESGELPK
jgi:hypothetical protein